MNIQNYKQWYNMKRAILKGLHCALCGNEHPTQLHHWKPISEYETAYDYWNDETQVPVCVDCHCSKLHILSKGGEPRFRIIDGVRRTVIYKKCMGGGFD